MDGGDHIEYFQNEEELLKFVNTSLLTFRERHEDYFQIIFAGEIRKELNIEPVERVTKFEIIS